MTCLTDDRFDFKGKIFDMIFRYLVSGHSPMTTDFMSGAREGPRGELRLQRPDAGAGACEGRTPRVEPRRRSGQEQFLSAHRVTPLPASPLLAATFRFLPRKYVLLVRLESWYYWPENRGP